MFRVYDKNNKDVKDVFLELTETNQGTVKLIAREAGGDAIWEILELEGGCPIRLFDNVIPDIGFPVDNYGRVKVAPVTIKRHYT
jgi:hypothetical protein